MGTSRLCSPMLFPLLVYLRFQAAASEGTDQRVQSVGLVDKFDTLPDGQSSSQERARRLSLNFSSIVRQADYTFWVRRTGRIDAYLQVVYQFDGGVVSHAQAPVLSNSGANCLSGKVSVSIAGKQVNSSVTDENNTLYANFVLPQPINATNHSHILTARFLYSIGHGVCEDKDGGPKKMYFPWVFAWNVTKASYRVQFPDEQVAGVTDFVCFGANDMAMKCGTQLELSASQGWAQYTTSDSLPGTFFQWDVPRTPSRVVCPEKGPNVTLSGPVAASCGAVVAVADLRSMMPRAEAADLGAKKWLVAICAFCVFLVVAIVAAGCLTRKSEDQKKEKHERERKKKEAKELEAQKNNANGPPGTPQSARGDDPEGTGGDSGGGVGFDVDSPNREQSEGADPEHSWHSQPSPLHIAIYWFIMFFAYWFGAKRFDFDGDGDFDVDDVAKWMAMEQNEKIEFIWKSFMRSNAQARPKGVTFWKAGAGSPQTFGSGGHMDVMDIYSGHETEGIQQEAEVVRNFTSGQAFPVFILSQTSLAFIFWLVCAIKNAADGEKDYSYAGLGTLAGGSTDLVLTNPSSDFCEDFRPQIWRWVTYQFTHGSLWHILMNSFANMFYGIPLEGVHGGFRMMWMYNVGVFGGACCALVSDPHIPVVGMSGGCYALLGMHIADLILNWYHKKFRVLTLCMLFSLALVDLLSLDAANNDVSHSAHVGGYVAGVLVAILFGKNYRLEKWERWLKRASWLVAFVLTLTCVLWCMVNWPPKDIWEEVQWCWARQISLPSGAACVRCGTQDCIDAWTNNYDLYPGSVTQCRKNGWLER